MQNLKIPTIGDAAKEYAEDESLTGSTIDAFVAGAEYVREICIDWIVDYLCEGYNNSNKIYIDSSSNEYTEMLNSFLNRVKN